MLGLGHKCTHIHMKHMKEPDQDLVSGSRLNISWAVANETLQGTKGLLGHVGGANETQTTQGGEGGRGGGKAQ